jgi:DNA-binding NtrC family response regulator
LKVAKDDTFELLLLGRHTEACPSGSCVPIRNWLAGLPGAPRVVECSSPDSGTLIEPQCIVARPSPHEGFAALYAAVRRRWPSVPLLAVFCADWIGLESVALCMNDGIDDFLRCPFGRDEVSARLKRLLTYGSLARRAGAGGGRASQPETLIGRSPKFVEALDKLESIAQSDATVLIQGETGTGKEVFGRAIHYLGPRRSRPFIPVNCGSLPDNLLENELFGHVKGAYTDASTSESGLLRSAEGGTLFLDEVDTLSMGSQIKLLRFLQDHEYRPLGSAASLTADVRVVAATNSNLRTLVEARAFREDLFYRLNILSLRIPALRTRLEDIPTLAEHFLERFRPRGRTCALRFSPAAMQKLVGHDWPGNIRELEGVLQRAVVLCRTPVITTADIDFNLDRVEPELGRTSLRAAKQTAIEHFERLYLIDLLDNHGGNISRAAKEAGKERRSLQRLIRKYNLDREQFRGSAR